MSEQLKIEPKPGQLSEEDLKTFFDKGYLIINDFFDTERLDACRKEIDVLVDKLANDLYAVGKIKNLYKDEGVLTRLFYINEEFPGANILLIKNNPKVPESFRALWTDERMLNIAEQIIGPDIMGHPVWNLRCKIPNDRATIVPWHQDAGYFDENALEVFQLTAWIPFVDVNSLNGTLQVAEKAHKHGLATHTCCYDNTWYVELDEDVMQSELHVDMEKDIKLCEMNCGSILLFGNLLPHRSLPNLSKMTRWTLDLRWQTPHKKNGLYGLKEGIVFRTKENPTMKPNWEAFDAVDRSKSELKSLGFEQEAQDPFDTTMGGPWMKKWEMVNTNRHTAAYQNSEDIAKGKA